MWICEIICSLLEFDLSSDERVTQHQFVATIADEVNQLVDWVERTTTNDDHRARRSADDKNLVRTEGKPSDGKKRQ